MSSEGDEKIGLEAVTAVDENPRNYVDLGEDQKQEPNLKLVSTPSERLVKNTRLYWVSADPAKTPIELTHQVKSCYTQVQTRDDSQGFLQVKHEGLARCTSQTNCPLQSIYLATDSQKKAADRTYGPDWYKHNPRKTLARKEGKKICKWSQVNEILTNKGMVMMGTTYEVSNGEETKLELRLTSVVDHTKNRVYESPKKE